jgi:type IV pilus assembly protein PilV
MSTGSRPARARAAGFTLLEVMIAMAILLVGLLGMMRFQMVGISSNNAGRMQTLATGIALELVSGIERLPFGDPLLSPTGTSGPTAPSPFGRLLADGSTVATGAHAWDDAAPIPGVRLSTEVPSAFERRWSVWGFSPSPGALPAVKIVAVSVVWTEPALRYPRELVLYTQLLDAPALVANLPANQ